LFQTLLLIHIAHISFAKYVCHYFTVAFPECNLLCNVPLYKHYNKLSTLARSQPWWFLVHRSKNRRTTVSGPFSQTKGCAQRHMFCELIPAPCCESLNCVSIHSYLLLLQTSKVNPP
jgi:hypothetical protein